MVGQVVFASFSYRKLDFAGTTGELVVIFGMDTPDSDRIATHCAPTEPYLSFVSQYV